MFDYNALSSEMLCFSHLKGIVCHQKGENNIWPIFHPCRVKLCTAANAMSSFSSSWLGNVDYKIFTARRNAELVVNQLEQIPIFEIPWVVSSKWHEWGGTFPVKRLNIAVVWLRAGNSWREIDTEVRPTAPNKVGKRDAKLDCPSSHLAHALPTHTWPLVGQLPITLYVFIMCLFVYIINPQQNSCQNGMNLALW